LLSDAFATRVLLPIEEGGALPHVSQGVFVPAELRSFAQKHFLRTLKLSGGHFKESWSRHILRLLLHEDSLLRVAPSGTSDGEGSGWQALFRRLQAAWERQAIRDPLVGHRLFVATATPTGADVLFRFVLGRPPGEKDNAAEAAKEGYPGLVRRLMLAPEFERNVLKPLGAGTPPAHVRQERLHEAQIEALHQVLGRPLGMLNDWPAELSRFLSQHRLIDALIGPLSDALPKQQAVGTAVRTMAASMAKSHFGPVVVQVEAGRVMLSVNPARLALPEDVRLTARLTTKAPGSLSLEVPLVAGAGGLHECHWVLPLVRNEPHTIEGRLEVFGPGDGQARLVAGESIFHEVTEASLAEAWAEGMEDVNRARFLADRARNTEAIVLLDALTRRMPGFDEALALRDVLRLIDGVATPASVLEEIARAAGGPMLRRLAAALHLRGGQMEAAAAELDELPESTELAWLMLALAAAGQMRGEPGEALLRIAPPWLWKQLARVLAAPERPHDLVAATLSILPAAQRTAVAEALVKAMALSFAGPNSVASLIQALSACGALGIDRLNKQAQAQGWLHLLLPTLAEMPPGSHRDVWIQLSVARRLQSMNRNVAALGFVERVLQSRPVEADALLMGATLKHRLGDTQAAIHFLERLLHKKPDDARLRQRVLTLELDLNKREPLRSRARADEMLAYFIEMRQRDLSEKPTDPQARFEYARAIAMADRFPEAILIVEELARGAPSNLDYKNEILRLGQLSGDHDAVLRWFERMTPDQHDERAVVFAVRAFRALGQPELAQTLLERNLHRDSAAIRREFVRNLFFVGEFESAMEAAGTAIAQSPGDLELRLLAAAANLEVGRADRASEHVEQARLGGGDRVYPLEMPLFRYAVTHKGGDTARAFECLDPMFVAMGVQPVRQDTGLGSRAFDQLMGNGRYPRYGGNFAPVFDGPKVSVIMTSYNVEDYVRTATRSILEQSYRNIELIIVDDSSTDSTPEILMDLERADPRVKIILKTTNDGTYVSKNMGLLQAQGEFIALQDSDDWSHPDRIARSVSVLMQRPEIVGLTTDWLRMTSDGDIVIKAGGQISHLCCISLVFRRKAVLGKVGFFDSVRIAADLEFIQRIALTFGSRSVPRLRWPLLFGRARSDSLTASEEFGISRTGFTEPRHLYHEHASHFHERIKAGSPAYLPFPMRARPFPAPNVILPNKGG
jgi:tetratricopeptide (TPR) repeat protein